jgi:signal recognition particle subunit SEC65
VAQAGEKAREEVQYMYDRFSDEQKPAFWWEEKTVEVVVDKSPGKGR